MGSPCFGPTRRLPPRWSTSAPPSPERNGSSRSSSRRRAWPPGQRHAALNHRLAASVRSIQPAAASRRLIRLVRDRHDGALTDYAADPSCLSRYTQGDLRDQQRLIAEDDSARTVPHPQLSTKVRRPAAPDARVHDLQDEGLASPETRRRVPLCRSCRRGSLGAGAHRVSGWTPSPAGVGDGSAGRFRRPAATSATSSMSATSGGSPRW